MAFASEDLILISVDDHIIEPPDLFDAHLPEHYKADAPRIVRRDDGADVWRFGEVEVPNVALNAVAGRPKEEYGVEPQSLEEIRPGCFMVDERIKDMNACGVLASMNFPSFPGFAARLFAVEDEEFGLALVRAYNDWHIDEWCGAHPGRFIPMALPDTSSAWRSTANRCRILRCWSLSSIRSSSHERPRLSTTSVSFRPSGGHRHRGAKHRCGSADQWRGSLALLPPRHRPRSQAVVVDH